MPPNDNSHLPESALRPWQPSASQDVLRARARMLANIREFFADRGVMEVTTPVLSRAAPSDINIESLPVDIGTGDTGYLHTSPEFAMKRLLAAGSGDIYQICSVFRAAECGRRHNPEFAMLEWYRLNFDHHQLMLEVDELLRALVNQSFAETVFVSYANAFQNAAGLDPHDATGNDIEQVLRDHDVPLPEDMNRDGLLDLLLATVVTSTFEPTQPTFVYDYPVTQAALARIKLARPPIAERFELFLGGMELANGFNELCDADDQKRRFDADLAMRRERAQPLPPRDGALLAALTHGIPDCAGVALGIDRLLMIATGTQTISGVLSFDFDRA